jgi:hypothetical protein
VTSAYPLQRAVSGQNGGDELKRDEYQLLALAEYRESTTLVRRLSVLDTQGRMGRAGATSNDFDGELVAVSAHLGDHAEVLQE